MSILWTIAEQAVARHMNGGIVSPRRSGRVPPGIYILGGFLVVAGLLFAMAGAYMALLAAGTPAHAAALAMAAGIFAATALLIVTVMAARTWQRRAHARHHVDNMAILQSLMQAVAEELEEPVRANPKTAVALAALAGAMAGDKLH